MAKHYNESKRKLDIKKTKKIVWISALLILIILAIISSINIIKWYLNNKENEDILKEISEAIKIDETKENENKYIINFNRLKEQNSDTIAFIKVNGTNVEFPVVQTINNDYYLTHNFNKDYNSAGWIFADYRNKLDGTDKNIIVYGHNTKGNTMFSSLNNILKEEWYNNEENYKIIFITENEYAIYEVFSIYKIEKEDYYIQTSFKDDEDYAKFIKTIKDRSIKNFNKEINTEDNILTLSTCANNNDYRIVLHAKKLINT